MSPDQVTDPQLLRIVAEADAELFNAGMDVKQRHWEVPRLLMQRFGYSGYVMSGFGKPDILKRIETAFASIYRRHDLAMGGHIGAYMYRDIFARFAIPLVFGTVALDPFDFVELTPIQKQLVQSDEAEWQKFVDQFSDVADVQHGTEALHSRFRDMELVVRFIELSRLHLHAAAAIVTGGYDHRGAVQSALLATELALKSAAATQVASESEIKSRFGHNLATLSAFAGIALPSFDADRVCRVIARQPEYVPNRYAPTQPDRREVGHTVMGAQYIVAEVVRQLSEENFRDGLSEPFTRRYPT